MKPAVVKKPGKLKSKRITRLLYGEKRPKKFQVVYNDLKKANDF